MFKTNRSGFDAVGGVSFQIIYILYDLDEPIMTL